MDEKDYRICQRAEKMLEDQDVEDILQAMRDECVAAWLESNDPVEREHMWHAARSVGDFRVMLERLATAKIIRDDELDKTP